MKSRLTAGNFALQGVSGVGIEFAKLHSMERLVSRVLPYWSIGINVLLALSILAAGGGSSVVVYGRKYAGRVFTPSEVTLLR
jgi:hypothetical protein